MKMQLDFEEECVIKYSKYILLANSGNNFEK